MATELKVSYVINGKRVELPDLDQLDLHTLTGYAVVKYGNQLVSHIQDHVCPEHGEAPQLEVSVDAQRDDQLGFRYKVSGCCNKFKNKVITTLSL